MTRRTSTPKVSRPRKRSSAKARNTGTMPKRKVERKVRPKKDTAGAKARTTGKVSVETPNVPGYSNNVDETKYLAMRDILLEVVPRKSPGLTQGEMFEAVRGAASQRQFPGSTHRWWAKCVQLDLEAKGILERESTTPLRWHRK
jgi:hypothetical protein